MRLFVALDLDDRAREAIAHEQERLRRSIEGRTLPRWVKPEQMHLTLVFLGEVDGSKASSLQADLNAPIALEPFDIVFAGLGVFPPHGAPRALWIGAHQGAAELATLQRELVDRVRRRDIAIEQRPFSPHLTIGRWKSSRPADRRRALIHGTDRTIARLHVDHATLYHSLLTSAGSSYTELARANLTTEPRR
jgi:2'-5' RNA ligase